MWLTTAAGSLNCGQMSCWLSSLMAIGLVMCAKVVQAEGRTKRKTQFFVFYPEAKAVCHKSDSVD